MSMFPISSGTLNTPSSFEFTGIPQTFTHLQVRIYGRSVFDRGAGDVSPVNNYVRFNGDAGNNYSNHSLSGTGSSIASSGSASNTAVVLGGTNPALRTLTGVYSNIIIDILDYANTNKNKTVKIIAGYDANGTGSVGMHSSVWLSTSAISTVGLFNDANYAIGTRFDLYGISTSTLTGA